MVMIMITWFDEQG